MVSPKSIALALAVVTTCAWPASAADLCDTLEASRSGNTKLFAKTMARFAGIFGKGDCSAFEDSAKCVHVYDEAGAVELFGSSSGMIIASTVGGSLQQCGYNLDGENVDTVSIGQEFSLEYYTETSSDDLNGAVFVDVVAMNDGNYRVTVEMER